VPGLSPDLARAIHRAMAPLAKDRFNTVAELREVIEPFALAARPPSLSNPGATPTPSAVAASPAPMTNGEYRAVPKTLPPEDEAPRDAGGSGVPPANDGIRGPTPLGGFSMPGHSPFGPVPNAGTVEAQPFFPQGTSPPRPMSPSGTNFDAPLPARPGGTAMGG